MYHVVEFEDGSLAVVLDKWYTPEKRNVLWPPLKEYNRAVRNLSAASTDWDEFLIKRTFYETEDLEIAKHKLKLAEEFSDINTGDEAIKTTRRQVKKPKRLVIESSSDGEQNESEEYERPPKFFMKKIPGKTDVKRPFDLSSSVLLNSQKSSCSQSYASSNEERRLLGWTQRSHSPVSRATSSGNTCSTSSKETQRCITQSGATVDELSVINTDQSVQRKLLENLVFIREQNKEILNLLKSSVIGSGSQKITSNGMPELPVELPCTGLNEVGKLEDYLSHKENFSALSSYLISLGGNNISSRTNRILRQMLTNSASCEFNFCGSRNKHSFSNLNLNKLIIDSVKFSISNATEKEIEDAIKVWLKHAPERLNKRRRTE